MILFAGTNGYVDKVPVERVREWETAFLRFMDTQHPAVGQSITAEKRITDENEKALRAAIEDFAGRGVSQSVNWSTSNRLAGGQVTDWLIVE